jgi:murein DD-endopeptidase MepM/ murein hydrolase activator NlpD
MHRAACSGLLAMVVWGSVSCQTQRWSATWDDVDDVDDVAGTTDAIVVSAPPPRTSAVSPAPTVLEATHENRVDDVSAGILIDRALVDFTNDRTRARQQGPTSGLWHRAWMQALDAIDDAVTRAPVAHDLGAFVRARVTLDVELVNDQRRGVLLPADLEARMARTLLGVDESVQELRAANAPGTLASTPRLVDGDLVLRAPLSPMIVSSQFGRRQDPFTGAVRYHSGVDLDAHEGAAIYASASGLVVYAGPQGGYGRYIVVDHGGGVRSHYAHCSKINTTVGALVIEGDVIGFVGSTGRSTGPHLHFSVTDDLGAFLDPMAVLDLPFDSLKDQVASKPGRVPSTERSPPDGQASQL